VEQQEDAQKRAQKRDEDFLADGVYFREIHYG
jgi:hypothetical protein